MHDDLVRLSRLRWWPEDAGLEESVTAVQPHGQPRTDLESLGWEQDLVALRPFLSYNELGSMLDEGSSKLYDALSSVLGLDELVTVEKLLANARKTWEKAYKDARATLQQLLPGLEQLDDGAHADASRRLLAGGGTPTRSSRSCWARRRVPRRRVSSGCCAGCPRSRGRAWKGRWRRQSGSARRLLLSPRSPGRTPNGPARWWPSSSERWTSTRDTATATARCAVAGGTRSAVARKRRGAGTRAARGCGDG
jgi:hypothetical protein